MNEPDDPKKVDEQPIAKRPYDTPRLTIYGDLRLRTWAMATGAMGDGVSRQQDRVTIQQDTRALGFRL